MNELSRDLWLDELASASVRTKVAFSGELEFAGATEDDRTGRVVKFRLVRAPEDAAQAHPFAVHTRRRRGHAGTRFEASFVELDGKMEGMYEVMLLNWGDGPQGATVTLLLNYETNAHPFLWCSRASKDSAGTRFMCVFVEVNDDDEIVDQERRERVEAAHKAGKAPQKLSNVAAQIIKNPRFHEWLRETQPEDTEWTVRKADAWLKHMLGVDSKADLDKEGPEHVAPVAKFHRMRAAFVEWQTAAGYDTTGLR